MNPFGIFKSLFGGLTTAIQELTQKALAKVQKKELNKGQKEINKSFNDAQDTSPPLEIKPEDVSSDLEQALKKALEEHEKQEANFQSVMAQNRGFTPEKIDYPNDTEDLVKKYTEENGGQLNADIATLRNTGFLMQGQAQNTQMLQMTGNTVMAMAQNMGAMNQAQSAFLENAPQTFQNMVDKNTENLNAVLKDFDEREKRHAKFWNGVKSGLMLGPNIMTATISAADKLKIQTDGVKKWAGEALGSLIGFKGIFNNLADSIPWIGRVRDVVQNITLFPKLLMEWLPKQFKKISISIRGGLIETRAGLAQLLPFGDNYDTYLEKQPSDNKNIHAAWKKHNLELKSSKEKKELIKVQDYQQKQIDDISKELKKYNIDIDEDTLSKLKSSSDYDTQYKILSELSDKANKNRAKSETENLERLDEYVNDHSILRAIQTSLKPDDFDKFFNFVFRLLKWKRGQKGGSNTRKAIIKLLSPYLSNESVMKSPGGKYIENTLAIVQSLDDEKVSANTVSLNYHASALTDWSRKVQDAEKAVKKVSPDNVKLNAEAQEYYDALTDNESAGQFMKKVKAEENEKSRAIFKRLGVPVGNEALAEAWMRKMGDKYHIPEAAMQAYQDQEDPSKRLFIVDSDKNGPWRLRVNGPVLDSWLKKNNLKIKNDLDFVLLHKNNKAPGGKVGSVGKGIAREDGGVIYGVTQDSIKDLGTSTPFDIEEASYKKNAKQRSSAKTTPSKSSNPSVEQETKPEEELPADLAMLDMNHDLIVQDLLELKSDLEALGLETRIPDESKLKLLPMDKLATMKASATKARSEAIARLNAEDRAKWNKKQQDEVDRERRLQEAEAWGKDFSEHIGLSATSDKERLERREHLIDFIIKTDIRIKKYNKDYKLNDILDLENMTDQELEDKAKEVSKKFGECIDETIKDNTLQNEWHDDVERLTQGTGYIPEAKEEQTIEEQPLPDDLLMLDRGHVTPDTIDSADMNGLRELAARMGVMLPAGMDLDRARQYMKDVTSKILENGHGLQNKDPSKQLERAKAKKAALVEKNKDRQWSKERKSISEKTVFDLVDNATRLNFEGQEGLGGLFAELTSENDDANYKKYIKEFHRNNPNARGLSKDEWKTVVQKKRDEIINEAALRKQEEIDKITSEENSYKDELKRLEGMIATLGVQLSKFDSMKSVVNNFYNNVVDNSFDKGTN